MELNFEKLSLIGVDYARLLMESLIDERFKDFLLKFDLKFPYYGIFHKAFTATCGCNISNEELPNSLLRKLLKEEYNVDYALFSRCTCDSELYIAEYKNVEIASIDIKSKTVEFALRQLSQLDNSLKRIENELKNIKETLVSGKIRNKDTILADSLGTIENRLNDIALPWDEFNKKQDELKEFFNSIGFTIKQE